MKIVYCHIDSPFKYHLSCLNDNLDYKPPEYESVKVFGTLLVRATSRTPCDINFSFPIDDGGKGGFDYTLKVPTVFNNVITNNNTSTFTMEQ